MSGRSPPLYCTLTLIAMQGHQKNSKNKTKTMYYSSSTQQSNIIVPFSADHERDWPQPPCKIFFVLFFSGWQPNPCVCVFSSHSFWTSSSLDVPAGVTQQEEGHTGFIIHLLSAVRAFIFLARKIQPFLPSSTTVKSNFVLLLLLFLTFSVLVANPKNGPLNPCTLVLGLRSA